MAGSMKERPARGSAFPFLRSLVGRIAWPVAVQASARAGADDAARVGADASARAGAEDAAAAGAEVAATSMCRKKLKRPAPAPEAPEKEVLPPRLFPDCDDGLFVVQLGVPPRCATGLIAHCHAGKDAMALAAMSTLWAQFELWKSERKLYDRCYYRVRVQEAPLLFGIFNAVRLFSRQAPGAMWEQEGKLSFAFLVVLEGTVRVEIDRHTGNLDAGNMVFMHGKTVRLSSPGACTAAVRVAVAFLEPIRERPDLARLQKVVASLAAAATQAQARIVSLDAAATVALGTPTQQRLEASPPPVPQGSAGAGAVGKSPGASWAETMECGKELTKPVDLQEVVAHYQPSVGSRPPPTRDARQQGMGMRWSQHRGVLLHRFFVSHADAPVKQWRELLRTWPCSFLQYVWTYREADFDELAGEVINTVRMDASLLLPLAEFEKLRGLGHPIQLLKDLIQLRSLQAFGGWYADLDIAWLRDGMWHTPHEWAEMHAGCLLPSKTEAARLACPGDCGFSPGGAVTALFFTESERVGDGYSKKGSKVISFGDWRVAVNLGLMWAQTGAPVIDLAIRRLREVCQRQEKAWLRPSRPDNPRMHPNWLQNQLAVQDLLSKCGGVRIAPPHAAFAMPRYLRRCPAQECILHGTRLQPVGPATASSFALCVWTDVWVEGLGCEVLRQAQAAVTESGASHGESCGAEHATAHAVASCTRGGGEGEAQAEGALLIQVVGILHRQGFEAFSQAGADLVLAHKCVSSAIGFANACETGALASLRLSAATVAYGFLCLAVKMHWPQNTLANGLARRELIWQWCGGGGVNAAPAQRQSARRSCEACSLMGGFRV